VYRHEHEPVTLTRDVEAIMVPAGIPVTLREGKTGFITQALGGSFTVYVEGNLFRIAGKDAEALGKEALVGPELPPDATDDDVKQLVWDQMRACYDPEIPINIVDLGLVYSCEIQRDEAGERIVEIKMTLTAPGCGMGPVLQQDVSNRLLSIEEVDEANVDLVWDPQWNQGMMTEAAKLQLGLL